MHHKIITKKTLFIFLTTTLFSQYCFADKKVAEQIEPPQEIFDACVNKSPGDMCSYTDNLNKTMTGKCTKDTRVVVCISEPEVHKE
ncbi:MAG: hypothetical protein JSR17_13705 [Proteobacteria bacterium]|nr:hypothetical protein [Pseudomonadota bacterium]